MRRFSSYGPVHPADHFMLERRELVERCVAELVGDPDRGGHFFTIHAPRQAGKTWLVRQAMDAIRARYGERFLVDILSLQSLMGDTDPDEQFLRSVSYRLAETLLPERPVLPDWDAWLSLFDRRAGLFDRPLILLIDEFDSLTRTVIDRVVGLFRQMYLRREAFVLHGLALIGVRAVLGVDSPRGSPFNVQRSLPVPNFSPAEVRELFAQYEQESGQVVRPEVVDALYEEVRGQPGLTCWFGELLTEKFNPGPDRAIDLDCWEDVLLAAVSTERNNNILNLIAKAKAPYAEQVHKLFIKPDLPFEAGQPWCDHLELNGVIVPLDGYDDQGRKQKICRFASPFVQSRLFHVFSDQLHTLLRDVPPVDGLDLLEDVFWPDRLDLVALLRRYKEHLADLTSRGRSPFADQPMRADFQLPEAVGHFHLYAWLTRVLHHDCVITPEFPTGNGRVDLRLLYQGQVTLLEVKSLGVARELPAARAQTARYARQQGLTEATLVVFLPTSRPEAVSRIEGTTEHDGVQVHLVAVSWRA